MGEIISRDKALSFDLKDEDWKKVVGTPKGGSMVSIIWNKKSLLLDEEEEAVDRGYCFELPDHCQDEMDVFIHITNPFNGYMIDDCPSVFVHLYELMTNKNILQIFFTD